MAQGNELQERNFAAEAFRKNYAALSDALAQPDVASWLATKLYSGAIITLETRDAVQMAGITATRQASLLLQAVESSIKIDHTRLRKFTRVMKKKPVLEPIARQLRQRYSELASEAGLTESSGSESDTDSTVQHQSRGQGNPKNSAAESVSLLSTSITTLPRTPVFSMLDQHEQEARESDSAEGYSRTQSWIKGLEGRYRDLVKKAQKEVMRRKPDLDEFRTEITLLPTSFREEHIKQYIKDNLPQLYEAKSIPEIFGLLNIRWNYLHYDLLQHIIDLYGSDDTKELMKSYIKNVKSFQQETTLAMFWEATDPGHMSDMAESSREKLAKVVTIHEDLTSGSLLKSIEVFRLKFAREISLHECVVVMKDILPGSVVVVWLIPAKGANTLKNRVKEGTVKFFKQHHILELRIDDVIVYSSEPQHSTSEEAPHCSKKMAPPKPLPYFAPEPQKSPSDMTLTVNDLSDVHGELYDVCTRWYDVGLALKVPVATLDSIDGQFNIYSDKLLQTLKVWLKTAIKPSWQDVVSVLKSPVVGEPKLASDIEAKYCTTAEVEQGQTMPELQRPKQVRGTVLLRQALRVSDQELVRVKDQLHESQRQNEELTLKVKTKNQQLESIEQREQAIEELRAASDQLKRQLQQAKQQVEEKQYATMEREKKVRELTVQLEAMKRAGQPPPIPLKAKRKMRWMKESKAPEKMHRGSTAVDANTAYFNSYDSTAVYSYNLDSREWHRLPDTPHAYSTLVVVQHMLTMVGGAILGRATDSLLSLGRDNKWLPNLPAMPTKRYFTAVVCSGHSLIVAGGRDGSNYLATVEVLDTDTQQWSVASSLTHPFSLATISICGERLYMLGGYDHTGKARCVLSCSLPELLKSCQTQPLAEKLRTAPANKSTIWRHVADAPHYYSSCATLCGQLVAVGGMEAGKNTSAITVYDETTDSWEAMGNMPTARRQALVAILNGKMMVIIGRVEGLVRTDVVGFLC